MLDLPTGELFMLRRMVLMAALLGGMSLILSPAAVQATQKDKKSKESAGIALIKLKGSLDDAPPSMPNPLTGSSMSDTLRSVQERIRKAAKDDNVKALVLHMEGFSAHWTEQNELRQTLSEFRKSGKKAHCYVESASMGGYLVAAACDEVILPPVGGLEIPGVHFEMSFYKDMLDKVGVKGDVVPLGDFKAAGEPFSRNKMSEANRKQWEKLADDYYAIIVETLAASRKGLDADKAKSIIDTGLFTPIAAVKAGLADKTGYLEETYADIKKSLNNEKLSVLKNYGKPKEDLDLSNPFAIFKLLSPQKETKLSDKPKLALIYANGAIETGKSSFGMMGETMGSTTMVELIRKAAEEPSVKAIVLRVDSPGGSALASDLIWKETVNCKKPIIVSMGAVAGSGGYYISCGADKIYAEPGTITGSIGVINMRIVTGGLWKMLGVNNETVMRGKHSDFGSSSRAYTTEERELIINLMSDIYDTFLNRVLEGRKKAGKEFSKDELKKYAGGRIWTGRTAKEIGLIDEVGTLDDAIAYAKKKVNLEGNVEIWTQPKGKGSFLDSLFDTQVTAQLQSLVQQVPGLQKHVQAFDLVTRHPMERMWLLMPYAVQSK
jgi:protease-4